MPKVSSFKKDPAFFPNLLVKFDKKFERVPFAPWVSNIVVLLIKSGLQKKNETLSGRNKLNRNPYYVHVHSKSIKRILLLFIPCIGNLIVALMDYSKHKQIQKEKQGTTPNAHFRLAKRYLKGDGEVRNLDKARELLYEALKDLENNAVPSLLAQQYLEHNFISLDGPYERAACFIGKMSKEKELSKLLKICHKRSKVWGKRIAKFKSKKEYNLKESDEMEAIKQHYDSAAKLCNQKLGRKASPQDFVEDRLRQALDSVG